MSPERQSQEELSIGNSQNQAMAGATGSLGSQSEVLSNQVCGKHFGRPSMESIPGVNIYLSRC